MEDNEVAITGFGPVSATRNYSRCDRNLIIFHFQTLLIRSCEAPGLSNADLLFTRDIHHIQCQELTWQPREGHVQVDLHYKVRLSPHNEGGKVIDVQALDL
jgi:hypothetical protein